MRLLVEHNTFFEYDESVWESATEVRLRPIDDPRTGQRCMAFNLVVRPQASVFWYSDFYGNSVHYFTVVPRHSSLLITATSTVETGTGRVAVEGDDRLKLYDFLGESRYVQFDPAVREFAEQFRRFESPLGLGEAVCRRMNEVLVYEPGVTGVHSTSAEVMALGRGVCQDFTQLMLATCRYLGVASRYVSGYVYAGEQAEGREQASHAWCELYGGPEVGWVGFDPTHSTLYVDERYVRIGAGRDYADVTPVRGVYKGNATQSLRVAVRVTAAQPGLLERGLVS